MAMNQFGNNLVNPYGQQDYSNFFSSKNNYNNSAYVNNHQGLNTNLIWVQGIEGAKALMLNPEAKVVLLDSEIENRLYIKVADELGATKLRKFELVEILEDEQPPKLSDYVRKDELQSLILSILPTTKESEVVIDEPTIQSTKPIIKKSIQ